MCDELVEDPKFFSSAKHAIDLPGRKDLLSADRMFCPPAVDSPGLFFRRAGD